ncbi:MAG: hypothetical protein IJO14_11075 [Clostridia bacterium]|nr:hypothetical protein [Clostridia bacterium]
MKKFIALFLSVLLAMGTIGMTASASSIVGCDEPRPPRPTRPVTTTCAPTTCAPTTTVIVDNDVTINNVTNNNIYIEAEQDPTTIMGFLYRVIKTIVPFLYKILSLFSFSVSFNDPAACSCTCNSCSNGGHCGNAGNCGNNNGGDVIVIPSVPSKPAEPTTTPGGNVDTDSSDSDSGSGILGDLFGDLFAGSES